jgi:hypothetical protein
MLNLNLPILIHAQPLNDCLLTASDGFLLALSFDPEDGVSVFLQKVRIFLN